MKHMRVPDSCDYNNKNMKVIFKWFVGSVVIY